MAPPPSTPTPHRFLVPKRSATQRTETPKTLHSGTQQFQATPRFSLHSTPREASTSHFSSTPAASTAFLRQRQVDSISDGIDSSPPLPEAHHGVNDSIEADSAPISSVLSIDGEFASDQSDHDGIADRSSKRRRFSVSSNLAEEGSLPLFAENGDPDDNEVDEYEELETHESDEDTHMQLESIEGRKASGTHQPTFQKAPRFKAIQEQGQAASEPLPEAFSPHRRGAKYVPGGLAAELRDWLMDIEASTGPKRDGDWAAKLVVVEARKAPGLLLAKARRATDDEDSSGAKDGASTLNVLLAGDGRLKGLAQRNEVVTGTLLGVAKPTWEVPLGSEGRWVVACDWESLGKNP